MTTHAPNEFEGRAVIYSESQAEHYRDGTGFWSNEDGWTELELATLFTLEESSRPFPSFIWAPSDARWMSGSEAMQVSLVNQIKTALRNDGFDVAQAPDGRWYSGDEQDRDEVVNGEYHTANQAWRDLAESRRHVLEEAGLDHAGAFPALASSVQMALQNKHASADASTVLHTVARGDGEYELRVCGHGDGAYFEWVDQLGDPVGDVFTMVDFDQVDATLAPAERVGDVPSGSM